METATIKTTAELLALRDEKGRIKSSGSLRIECDVPWRGVGELINGLCVGGNLYVRGNLYVGGYLDVRGYLDVGGNLDVRGYLDVGGNLDVRGYLYVRGNLCVGGYLDVRGNLYVRGEYLVIRGDLIWSHAATPSLPEKTYIKRVIPPEWQRDYYQDRLGMDISVGCYDAICYRVLKQILNLLRDEKWTPTERWMLETLRDSEKEPPQWVAELKAEAAA